MSRRLFWKILLGFWTTFMVLVVSMMMYVLLSTMPERSDYAQNIAHMTVAAAAAAIRSQGEAALQSELATWPQGQRDHLLVRPADSTEEGWPPLARTIATAPNGARYRIAYYFQSPASYFSIFIIPARTWIASIIGGLIFSAVLAGYLTRPIERIRVGFRHLAQGRFSTRLGPSVGRRRDEIADLARDFDIMAARLEELVGARDKLLADVSHELRTPLSRLNLAIELVRRDPSKLSGSLDRISNEVIKLDNMVGELLTLAKLESREQQGEEYFSFAEIARTVITDAAYEAGAKGVKIGLSITPSEDIFPWLARGNGRLVNRAIENIVRNAIRYTPKGSDIAVSLSAEQGVFKLLVSDEGPGVTDPVLGTLFEPFSVSADGSGFGLGLAIAQRSIAVHGGSISGRNRSDKGFEISVVLPEAPAEHA